MSNIVGKDHHALREVSKEVPIEEIGSPRLQRIISEMKKAVEEQPDGVAIAAPQIGETLRIFVVSKRVFDIEDELRNSKKSEVFSEPSTSKDMVFINPRITRLSKKKTWMEEGCLSVRWLYGKVERATKTTIEAYDENGERFTRGASGLLAQVFQHETDHLNGILFIDKARDIQEVHPEDFEK